MKSILEHSARIWALSACLVLGFTLEARAQGEFRAWVGLYDPGQLGWLENENRIDELCRDSLDLSECYRTMLGPSVHVHPLFAEPDERSDRIGELIVVAVPGRGLSSHFHRSGSGEGVSFSPDLFLQDWGYGPFFHQTLSLQRGSWFQLPPAPWEEAVWLRREESSPGSAVLAVRAWHVLEMGGAGWFVVSAEADALGHLAFRPKYLKGC